MVGPKMKREFAKRIHEIGAFKDKSRSPGGDGFRITRHETEEEAPLSPYYLDFRLLQSNFYAKRMAVAVFEQMLPNFGCPPDLLGAIPEAIVPIVSTLSDHIRIPMVTLRSGKTHGSGDSVNGIWEVGQTIILIDDVVSHADSKIAAAITARAVGLQVREAMVLVDRQQGGEEQLKAQGLTLHSGLLLDELLGIYREEKLITIDVYDEIMAYRAAQA